VVPQRHTVARRASPPASPDPAAPATTKRQALLLAGGMAAGLGGSVAGAGAPSRAAAATSAEPAAATTSGPVAAVLVGGSAPSDDAGAVETFEVDPRSGLTRLRYSPSGYRTWMWAPPPDVMSSSSAAAAASSSPSRPLPPPLLRINWAAAGPVGGPPALLVHGYGASAYHWRYTMPALAAQGLRVFAVDLAGFGWSERSVELEYGGGRAWARQLAAFCEQVIAPEYAGKGGAGGTAPKVAIAGNSLGGYSSLAAAAARPDLISAIALLNSAGPFETQAKPQPQPPQQRAGGGAGGGGAAAVAASAAAAAAAAAATRSAEEIANSDGDVYAALDARQRRLEADAQAEAERAPLSAAARRLGGGLTRAGKRAALFLAFQRARQPEQIRSVLRMVYASQAPVDDDLVASIVAPTGDPRSADVFALINGAGKGGDGGRLGVSPPPLTVDAALLRLRRFGVPVALVWGERDPWITQSRARQIMAIAPEAKYYGIAGAGHCPHDDAPAETSAALAEFFLGARAV